MKSRKPKRREFANDLLYELALASWEVSKWPKWMRIMHERCKAAEAFFTKN